MFFSCCDSVLGDSLQFHQRNRGSLRFFIGNMELLSMKCRGIGPHLVAMGKSHEFSRVAAGTGCIFSSNGGDGHLKLGFVQGSQDSCLVMMDTAAR